MTRSPHPIASSNPPLTFHQEFRLGLVVYGGVSLAIYMNGVCREFYNAVRGRGIYRLLKAITDSDIIVDVVSGTSAGGINGILLSYALANSDKDNVVDFKNFANLWRDSGDINKLLRETSAFANKTAKVESLLNGEGFYQDRLVEAFQLQPQPAPTGECFSDSDELDLFVTGTDLLGKVYKAFDNTGQLIEVKDHRTVFLLKHRKGRRYPFSPKPTAIPQKALAKLCRITSCFPVAFPVVTVKLESDDNTKAKDPDYKESEYAVDQLLVEWGRLDDRELPPPAQTTKGRQLHFADGGVLDNRPFSYTIEAIYNRTAYRPVERKLFYIDPSPDQFLNSPKFRKMERPSIWRTAIDSLVSMPRYESIANDLQQIKDRNERVLRYKFLRATAEASVEQETSTQRRGCAEREALRQAIKQQSVAQTQPPESSAAATPEQIYLRCRLVGLRDRVLPLVLRLDGLANPNSRDREVLLTKAAKLLTQYITNSAERKIRENFLHEKGKEIRNLDVDYARRKHFFILGKICQQQGQTPEPQAYEQQTNLAKQICAQVELVQVIEAGLDYMLTLDCVAETFEQLIEAAQAEVVKPLTDLLDEVPIQERRPPRRQIYEFLLALHRFLLDAQALPSDSTSGFVFQPPLSPAALSDFLIWLKQRADRLSKEQNWLDLNGNDSILQQYQYQGEENDSDRYRSLLSRVEAASEDLICASGLDEEAKDSLLTRFQTFRLVDQQVYAYEYLSDIEAKEQIEIIRISPIDAQKGFGRGRGLDDKLACDQLRAFGGFFKKSWRSNDILWGRLDGVNRIVDALITPESLKHLPEFLARQGEPPERYLKKLITESLPAATKAERTEIFANLLQFVNSDPKTTLTEKQLEQLVYNLQEQLVRVEHRAILRAELGSVLEDAIDDQVNWNEQKVVSRDRKDFSQALEQLRYQPVFSSLDVQNPQNSQIVALSQIDQLLKNLVNPRLLAGVATLLQHNATAEQANIDRRLPLIAAQPQASKNASKQGEQRYLDYLLQTAFPHSLQQEDDRQPLIKYPLMVAQSAATSIDQLYVFLNSLLAAGRAELAQAGSNVDVINALKKMNEQLQQMIRQLQPRYNPVMGYFDRTVTPFAAKELARTSTQQMLKQRQEDEYFRNQYRVGAEKLTDSVPSVILQNLAARAGLVLRDILASPPTGDRVRPSLLYRFVNSLLQLFYWTVRLRSPKNFLVGRAPLVRILIELLFPLGAIVLTLILVTQLPTLVLVAAVSVMILALLYIIRIKLFG